MSVCLGSGRGAAEDLLQLLLGERVPLGVRLFVLLQQGQVVLLLGDRLTIQIEVVKSEPVAGAVEVLVQDEAVLGKADGGEAVLAAARLGVKEGAVGLQIPEGPPAAGKRCAA